MNLKKILVAVPLGMMIFAACQKTPEEGNAEICFESYAYDTVAYDKSADSLDIEGWQYVRFTGSGVLPKDVNNSDIRSLRDTLMKLAQVRIDEKTIMPDADTVMVFGNQSSSVEAAGYAGSSMTIALMTPKVIVWQVYRSSLYPLAAHGMYSTSFLNYDVSNNKVLSLNSIVPESKQREILDIVRSDIAENCRDMLLVSPSEIELPDNFALTPTGIKFCYPLYSIAPYAAGEVTSTVEAYQIEDILTPLGRDIFMIGEE